MGEFADSENRRIRMGQNQSGGTNMHKTQTKVSWAFVVCLIGFLKAAIAQDTNVYTYAPATRLESFVTNVGTVGVRGSADIGTVLANTGTIVLKCREVSETGSGRKEVGISIDLQHSQDLRETRFIDFDELESLINALTYLNKADWSITSLNSFDAAITTNPPYSNKSA